MTSILATDTEVPHSISRCTPTIIPRFIFQPQVDLNLWKRILRWYPRVIMGTELAILLWITSAFLVCLMAHFRQSTLYKGSSNIKFSPRQAGHLLPPSLLHPSNKNIPFYIFIPPFQLQIFKLSCLILFEKIMFYHIHIWFIFVFGMWTEKGLKERS